MNKKLILLVTIPLLIFSACSNENRQQAKEIASHVSEFIYSSATYDKIKNYEKKIAEESKVEIPVENNQAVIALDNISEAIDNAKRLNDTYQQEFDASEEEEQVKEIETTVIVEMKDVGEQVKMHLSEDLVDADVDNIILKANEVEITVTPEMLKEEFDNHNGITISVEKNGEDSHQIIFLNDDEEEIKFSNNVMVSVISKRLKNNSVIYALKDGAENLIGGRVDGNKLTFQIKVGGDFSTGDNQVNFKDIGKEDKKTQEAIIALATKGIFESENSKFNPKGTLTRADAVDMITKTLYKYDVDYEANFSDVSKDDWYYVAVASAVNENIVNGYPDNTFLPENMISKQELLTISANTLVSERKFLLPSEPIAYLSTYESEIDDWARPYVAMTIRDGIIYQDFATNGPGEVTRAEAALILYNLFERL